MPTTPETVIASHRPFACSRGIFPPVELDESLSVLASPNRACFVQTLATPSKRALVKLGPFLLIDLGRREIWSGIIGDDYDDDYDDEDIERRS